MTPLHLIVTWAMGCIVPCIAVFESECVERLCTTSESGAVSEG